MDSKRSEGDVHRTNSSRLAFVLLALASMIVGVGRPAVAGRRLTAIVSVSSQGRPSGSGSGLASSAGPLFPAIAVARPSGARAQVAISDDCQYVAFTSVSADLVTGDTNGVEDVFVRDLHSNTTSRVSVGPSGEQLNGPSRAPSISNDGRYVAFESDATNIGSPNGVTDVFVRDVFGQSTVAVTGALANGASTTPSISGDGQAVAFESDASTLVPGDTNGVTDVFLFKPFVSYSYDRVSLGGVSYLDQSDGPSFSPVLSRDGSRVAFVSEGTNLVDADTNGVRDVFVRDLADSYTFRASVSSTAVQADGPSDSPSISQDGRTLAFRSDATNLVPGDTNAVSDVFFRDIPNATTLRVSVSSSGAQGNGASDAPSISPEGFTVSFTSDATNLDAADTNAFSDVYVRDLGNGVTKLDSVASNGANGNGPSYASATAPLGLIVVFTSRATNFAGGTDGSPQVYTRADAADGTCGPGSNERGAASSRIHTAEGSAGPLGPPLHQVNCGVVVPTGL